VVCGLTGTAFHIVQGMWFVVCQVSDCGLCVMDCGLWIVVSSGV